MDNSDLETKIMKYISENFLYRTDYNNVDKGASLIGSGVFDSTGILEIITYLEEKLNIKVEDEEVIPDNFDSINAITTFTRKKLDGIAKGEAI